MINRGKQRKPAFSIFACGLNNAIRAVPFGTEKTEQLLNCGSCICL